MKQTIFIASAVSAIIAALTAVVLTILIVPRATGNAPVVTAQQFDAVDQQGHVRARLGTSANNAGLTILDTNGTERVSLQVLADGTSIVSLADNQGRFRTNFYVNAGGTTEAIQFFNEEGKPQQVLDASGLRRVER
jgi:hypothetical protein